MQQSLDDILRALREKGAAETPQTLNDLGVFLAGRGRIGDAIQCYERALGMRPDYPLALNNLGLALQESGRIDAAIAAHRRAVALDTNDADGRNGLAAALVKAGKAAEAIDQYHYALVLDPNHVEAMVNLGNLLRDADRLEEAAALHRRAAALRPHTAEVLNTLGLTLRECHERAAAIDCFRRAIAAAPQHVSAHVNLGMALLAEGRFDEGAREYEWRWRGFRDAKLPDLGLPVWTGEPLGQGALLLWSEQGLGDTIQFARYAPLLRERAQRIVLACPAALVPLLRGAPGLDAVVAQGQAPPPADAILPLLSLMHRLGTTLATIPAPIPYLAADPARRAALAPLLAGEGLKIGLVWAGHPKHPNDRRRSIPLALLRPLIERAGGARFFSLHYGPRAAEDIAAAGLADRVADLAPHLTDFADTAAVVSGLDLVIAVDTAVAHLAGALGRPCWLLLPFSADWRWLTGRSDSPWYPTLRLFRQERPGAWEPVIAAAATALAARVG